MSELSIIEKVIALEAVDLFRGLSAEQIWRIGGIAHEITVPPGRAILDADANVDSLYVIVDGQVELIRNGQLFHTAQRGEVLGSWALFDEAPLAVGARSVADVRLLRISRVEFFDLLSDNMQITAAIFRTIVKRFRTMAGS